MPRCNMIPTTHTPSSSRSFEVRVLYRRISRSPGTVSFLKQTVRASKQQSARSSAEELKFCLLLRSRRDDARVIAAVSEASQFAVFALM